MVRPTGAETIRTVPHDFTGGELSHAGRDRREVRPFEAVKQSQHLSWRLHLGGRHHALAQRARESDRYIRHDLNAACQEGIHLYIVIVDVSDIAREIRLFSHWL